MIEELPYTYVLIKTHAIFEKIMSHTVVIDSVGAPFHFAAFHCDLRTELALLYILFYCTSVYLYLYQL